MSGLERHKYSLAGMCYSYDVFMPLNDMNSLLEAYSDLCPHGIGFDKDGRGELFVK